MPQVAEGHLDRGSGNIHCMDSILQGKMTFPNGFTLEGSFSSGIGRGLHTQGMLDTAALPPDPSSTSRR